jgi:NADH-quinone oxidoreductase subunit A
LGTNIAAPPCAGLFFERFFNAACSGGIVYPAVHNSLQLNKWTSGLRGPVFLWPFAPAGVPPTGAQAPSNGRAERPVAEREQRVLAEYLPTLLFLVTAAGIGVALVVIGGLFGPRRPSPEKLSAYESGFEAFDDARMQFDVRYYLIAIQFIVFDLEIIFIIPWATVFRDLGVVGLVEMGIFAGLLLLGFIYVWKKGALEWE